MSLGLEVSGLEGAPVHFLVHLVHLLSPLLVVPLLLLVVQHLEVFHPVGFLASLLSGHLDTLLVDLGTEGRLALLGRADGRAEGRGRLVEGGGALLLCTGGAEESVFLGRGQLLEQLQTSLDEIGLGEGMVFAFHFDQQGSDHL